LIHRKLEAGAEPAREIAGEPVPVADDGDRIGGEEAERVRDGLDRIGIADPAPRGAEVHERMREPVLGVAKRRVDVGEPVAQARVQRRRDDAYTRAVDVERVVHDFVGNDQDVHADH